MVRETKAGYVVELDGVRYFCGNIRPTKTMTKIPFNVDISRMDYENGETKFTRLRAPQDLQLINQIREILYDNIEIPNFVL